MFSLSSIASLFQRSVVIRIDDTPYVLKERINLPTKPDRTKDHYAISGNRRTSETGELCSPVSRDLTTVLQVTR